MKTNYYIPAKSPIIKDAADKIFSESEKLKGVFLLWEILTQKYLLKDLPVTQLDRNYWVQYRSTWVELINNRFACMKYPCRLFVENTKGVRLFLNGEAVSKWTVHRTGREIQCKTKTIDECKDMLSGFPDYKKALLSFHNLYKDALYAFSGRIDSSKELPNKLKIQLKAIVQKGLREDQALFS